MTKIYLKDDEPSRPLPIISYRRRHYYVDERIKQFRSIPKDFGVIEFVEFASYNGRLLLAHWHNSRV